MTGEVVYLKRPNQRAVRIKDLTDEERAELVALLQAEVDKYPK